jgi:hypothetical protein
LPDLHWAAPYRFFPRPKLHSLSNKLPCEFRSAQARPRFHDDGFDWSRIIVRHGQPEKSPKIEDEKKPGQARAFC